jgi:lysophospholipase L1-like esterase
MRLSLLAFLWSLAAPCLWSQGTGAAKPATSQEDVAASLLSQIAGTVTSNVTEDQLAGLSKTLPKAYEKLAARKTLHIVAVGDELVDMAGSAPPAGNVLKSFAGIFADQLSQKFGYPGGVRVIAPNRRQPDRSVRAEGTDITLRCIGRSGTTMLHAMQSLSTFGFESQPDIVLLAYGRNDVGTSLSRFTQDAEQAVKAIKAKGAELLLLAPPLWIDEPAELSLGMTAPYASVLKELANKEQVFFADLGELTALVDVLPEFITAEQIFPAVVESYTRFHQWQDGAPPTTPTARMHDKLGRWLLQQAAGVAKPVTWQLRGLSAVVETEEKLLLKYELKNASKQKLTFTLLPLVTPRWSPLDAVPQVELEPGASQELSVIYGPSDESRDMEAGVDEQLRLPVFISADGLARVEAVTAAQQPLALVWRTETLFNQTGSFMVNADLVNSSTTAVQDAAWTAEWQEQKLSGTVSIPAGQRAKLELKLLLPAGDARQASAALKLNVKAGATSLQWQRGVEVQRNVGLKERVTLLRGDDGEGDVVLHTDADEGNFFIMLDLKSLSLESDESGVALMGQLALDARSYGQRQTLGATEPLSFATGGEDGPGRVAVIAPWAFGTGYGFLFDETAVRCQLMTRTLGRRVQITLPRSYLRLHEWAIGNGNSQLGMHLSLAVWTNGETPGFRSWNMAQNLRPTDDALRLPQLELTTKSTGRWSVITW